MINDNSNEILNSVLDESSYLSKLALPLKVKKINKSKGVSITCMGDLIKYHYNPGLRQICQTSKDIDEIKYLRDDIRTSIPQLNKIQERMYNCRKLGECDKTKSYYKYIKKKYLDRGLTENDVKQTIVETQKTIQVCNNRIKELKKAMKENTLFESFQYGNEILNELFFRKREEKISRQQAVKKASKELQKTLSYSKEYKTIKDNTRIYMVGTNKDYEMFYNKMVDIAAIATIASEKVQAKANDMDRPFNILLEEIVESVDHEINPDGFKLCIDDYGEGMIIYVKSKPV